MTIEAPRTGSQPIRVDARLARIPITDSGDGPSTIFTDRGQIGLFLETLLSHTSFEGLRAADAQEHQKRIESVASYLANGPHFEPAGPTGKTIVFGPNFLIGEDGMLEFSNQQAVDTAFLELLPKGCFFGVGRPLGSRKEIVARRTRVRFLLEKLGLFDEADIKAIAGEIAGKPEKPHFQAATTVIEDLQRWQRGASMQTW